MSLEEFVSAFADEMSEVPEGVITADTKYKTLEGWDSLASLSIISMVDDEFGKLITGADVRSHETVKDLYEFVISL